MPKALHGLRNVTPKPRGPKVGPPSPLNLNAIFAMLSHFEGKHDYMYLDSECFVTIGIGHLLPNESSAASLAFVSSPSSSGGSTASSADPKSIRRAFRIIAGQKCPHNFAAKHYAKLTNIRIPDKEIRRLLEKDVHGFIGEMSKSLPDFLSYPDPARRALIDMIFNLGHDGLFPGGKKPGFPTMIRHVKAREWKQAGKESRRQGIQPERNDFIEQLFNFAEIIEPSTKSSKLPKKSP